MKGTRKIQKGDYIFIWDKGKKIGGKVSDIYYNKGGNQEVDVLTIDLDREGEFAYRYECKLDTQRTREERLKKLLDK